MFICQGIVPLEVVFCTGLDTGIGTGLPFQRFIPCWFINLTYWCVWSCSTMFILTHSVFISFLLTYILFIIFHKIWLCQSGSFITLFQPEDFLHPSNNESVAINAWRPKQPNAKSDDQCLVAYLGLEPMVSW